ncbi:MAG: hypothetical protein HY683_09135 [Chloroflexi bacterium]|nr:hypothetical protein [Chloroflexota bacterium]
MRSQKAWLLLMGVLGLVFVFSLSCASRTPTPTAPAAQPTATTPRATPTPTATAVPTARPTRVLRIAQAAEPVTLFAGADTDIASILFHANVFDCLVDRKADHSMGPGLATSWKTVDPTTWEFTLRPGLKWHDGSPVDAQSVADYWNFLRTDDAKTLRAAIRFKGVIKDAQPVGTGTVRFVTEQSEPILPNLLSGFNCGVGNAKSIKAQGLQKELEKPVGTGAYRVVEWKRQVNVELARNPDWFGERGDGDTAIIRPIPDQGTRVAALLAGEVDMIVTVEPDSIKTIQGNPNAHVTSTHMVDWMIYYPHLKATAPIIYQSKEFRQAVSMAIDREAIARDIFGGYAVPMRGVFPNTNPSYDASLAWPYDQNKAKELLAKSGYAGQEIVFQTGENIFQGDRLTTEAIVNMVQKIGVNAKIELLEAVVREQIVREKTMKGFMIRLPADFAYDGSVWWASIKPGAAIDFWRNERADQLMGKDCAVMFDLTGRNACYKEAQKIMFDEVPILQIVQVDFVDAVSSNWDWKRRPNEKIVLADFKYKGR